MLASSSSLSGARSETDMESSVMKKSLTLPGNLSQWSKKMSTSWTSFGKVRTKKKSTDILSTKSTAELMKNYEFEEDQFLRELELLQQTSNSGVNVNDTGGAGGLTFMQQHNIQRQQQQQHQQQHQQQQQQQQQQQNQQRQQQPSRQRRPSRSTSEASSVASSICVSAQSDLLGSFCHLMNYVVHLRRENRHLRKQVLCLQEMRKIEQLQNELLRAACTCCGDGGGSLAVDTAATTSASGTATKPPAIMNRSESMRTPTVNNNKNVRGDVITTTKKPTAAVEIEELRNVEKLNRPESASLGRLKSVRKALAESGRGDPLLLLGGSGSTGHIRAKDTTPSVAESRTPEDPLSSAASLELPINGGSASSVSPVVPVGLPPRPSSSSMADIRRQRGAAPPDSRLLTARSAALLSPKRTTSAGAMVRHSAEEALAEPTGADLNHLLMQTSAEFSSSSLLSNPQATNKTTSEDISNNRNLSDSEDQTSVFAEVQLPTLKDTSSTTNGGGVTSSIAKYRTSRDSRYHPFPAVSGSSKSTTAAEFGGRNSTAAAILERLGIRPLKSRRTSQQDQERRTKSACYANFAASPTDWSRCTSASTGGGDGGGGGGGGGTSNSAIPSSSLDVDKWKLVRKAFIKKRKRKISESDSVASSDTSSKQPYATVELPDISYTRKNSYPPAVPVVTTVDVEALQRSVKVSKEYTQKMKDWEDKKRFNVTTANISPKGNQAKRSWLKRSKQQRVDSSSGGAVMTAGQQQTSNGGERYFEMDDNGRQLTVIQHDEDDGDDDDYAEQRLRSASRSAMPSHNSGGNRWLSPSNVVRTEFGRFGSEINLKDSSDVKAKLAVSVEPRRKEIDKRRSVTFCDHSGADTLSIATSQMTVSNDSVFTNLDADFNNGNLCSNGGSDLVQHLLTLQERNSLLIRTLREKTEEYEKITDQLSSLENEVKLLRDRYRYDTALENIYGTLIDPSNYVPCSMVEELENQIQTLDTNIRSIKSEAYHTQQVTMESYLKEQAASRRYLDQIETLQKTNLQLIQRHLSDLSPYDPEMRRQFQIIQNYDALFRFTINLLRKVKHYRCKLLEKHSSVTKLDFELVQTQSSLLLAHAQIERQKMELKSVQNHQRQMRRAQSYNGQDVLLRLINSQMSFYLPFKLHGSRLSKIDHHLSDFSLYDGEDVLENEFARLFESANRISGNYEELELPIRDFQCNNYNNAPNRRSIASGEQYHSTRTNDRPKSCLENHNQISMRQNASSKSVFVGGGTVASKLINNNRPGSCIVPTVGSVNNSFDRLRQSTVVVDFGKINEETPKRNNAGGNSPQRPVYATKAPTPLKLGNVGQVRSIAAVFDLPPPNDNPSSAPNTPLSKGAPHLCHSRDNSATYRRLYDSPPSQIKFQQQQQQQQQYQQQQQQQFIASGNNVVVMRNSSNIGRGQNSADRMAVSSTFKPQSRIPVRQVSVVETPSQLGYSQPLLSAKQASPPNSDRPYETLTFRRNVKCPVNGHHVNHQFLAPGDFMDKSSTPEFETTSLSTSAGSNWSIAKRNEARRRQFFYGDAASPTVDPRINATNTSSNSAGQSPPPPAVSPSPPKSPVPSSPTPLLGRSSSKSSKLITTALKQHNTTKDHNTKQVQNITVQETAKKRTSWFQKFRQKK